MDVTIFFFLFVNPTAVNERSLNPYFDRNKENVFLNYSKLFYENEHYI